MERQYHSVVLLQNIVTNGTVIYLLLLPCICASPMFSLKVISYLFYLIVSKIRCIASDNQTFQKVQCTKGTKGKVLNIDVYCKYNKDIMQDRSNALTLDIYIVHDLNV